jgi:MFS family permease
VLGAAAWRRPVLELGLFGLLATAAFAWLAEEERPGAITAQKQAHPDKLFPTSELWFFFLLCALAFSLRDFAGTSMGSLGSLFLQNARGYDPKKTGIALSGLFLASAISNPIFGGLSDRGRNRWTTFVLIMAGAIVILLPHTPPSLTMPLFVVYGFFFLSSYPMTEAALMESVPDKVRGRVFGLFITVGGLIGNLSHWIVGAWVKQMGPAAYKPNGYYGIYAIIGVMLLCSLLGLPCLHAIRKREEKVEPGVCGVKPAIVTE